VSDRSAQIRILAVDDHVLVREGIAVLISTEPDLTLVAEAANGREAIQQFRAHRPDITLMDLQMPEMNGLDAIIAIRGEFPDAKIIVLTTYKGDVQIIRALKAGAQAYLLKNTFHKELLETIRAVHAGKKALSPETPISRSPISSRSRRKPSRGESRTSFPNWAPMTERRRQ
jgi:DNA-binding NarL/FixJ family response regulator